MLSKKVKMSNENEIKLLIENSKIGKQLKEKLIAFNNISFSLTNNLKIILHLV